MLLDNLALFVPHIFSIFPYMEIFDERSLRATEDYLLFCTSTLGMLCLLSGLAIGIAKRQPRFLWFFLPFCFSEIFLVVAQKIHGAYTNFPELLWWISCLIFLSIEAFIIRFILSRLKNENRLGIMALFSFCLCYAFFVVLLMDKLFFKMEIW